jgi:hypothetical protein
MIPRECIPYQLVGPLLRAQLEEIPEAEGCDLHEDIEEKQKRLIRIIVSPHHDTPSLDRSSSAI